MLKIGIVGLPNVGKSTLFKILTKQEVNIANYPFATIDPNVGVVLVPDERLNRLAEVCHSEKIVPAVVEFYDIAGLVKGAYKGEGLGNQFLSHIKEVQAIVHLVRCFSSEEIVHVENKVDPLRDIDTINTELIFKDLELVERRLDKAESEAHSGNKEKIRERDILKKIKEALDQGISVSSLEMEIPAELNLLTVKPQIFLLNGKEEEVSEELKNKIKSLNSSFIIADLSERSFRKENPDLSSLIRESYRILDLISFFTAGEKESRAWTIKRGTKMPQAAGVIHTDFEKNFIRAEVVDYENFIKVGGWAQAKNKGLVRIEGKECEVKEGDVVFIRHG